MAAFCAGASFEIVNLDTDSRVALAVSNCL